MHAAPSPPAAPATNSMRLNEHTHFKPEVGFLSLLVGIFTPSSVVFSCALTWRGPRANPGRDKLVRQPALLLQDVPNLLDRLRSGPEDYSCKIGIVV